MKVLRGKNAGFCFGVKRAIEQAEKLCGDGNYVLGHIIHNESVIEKLSRAGVKTIDSIDDVTFNKGDNLLIRTHGEPKSIIDKAYGLGVNVIDCTCPFVKEIHKIVEKHFNEGYQIAIIGNASHPEVVGINGWCNNTAIITESAEELTKIQCEKLCVVVQTTYSEEKFDKIVENFTFTKVKTVDIFKTICYTTKERQREAEIISASCDAVITPTNFTIFVQKIAQKFLELLTLSILIAKK